MPPRFKFTKEEIIANAIDLVRTSGLESLTARGLALKLGSSPKPIFGLFSNMEEVKAEVLTKANEIYTGYLTKSLESKIFPDYKASGMGYIQFAKEEPQLFKLLFMCDRKGKAKTDSKDDISPFIKMIVEKCHISEEKAYLFHLEMWVYVHGIATMAATSYLEWDLDFISASLTDIFEGLKHRFSEV